MAVYKRGYQSYQGPLTPEWSRFLILARYAYRRVFDSKLLLAFYVVCFIPVLVDAVLIYLPFNAAAMELGNFRQLLPSPEVLFFQFLQGQAIFAFLMTAFIGPSLVSTDLANNALPLYFCRPFSRTEYVIGKMAVLAILLSSITWVPGLMLWVLKAGLEGWEWGLENWWMAGAVFAGAWLWIALLCLMALAVSAWVRWRMVAGAIILGLFFVAAGFGESINEAMHVHIGDVFNITTVMGRIWTDLFRIPHRTELGVETAWGTVVAGAWLCLFLLNRKVRAYEVVK